MPQKRMRVFAGPNGSGKTTIVKTLENKINFGVYVNADDIERTLRYNKTLSFDDFELKIEEDNLQDFFKKSTFSPIKRNEPLLWKQLTISNNILYVAATIDSYIAADIAEFIRQALLNDGQSFTYETVMSHENKISFLEQARQNGYKVYLYYVATEDPEINVSRVSLRVAQHGHNVNEEIVRSRYYKSLQQLKPAVKLSNRAYIFDNSGIASLLVAEVTEGLNVKIVDPEKTPNWIIEYLAS